MTVVGKAKSGLGSGPASQQDMRRRNLSRVLGAVAAHSPLSRPLSRADVAGRVGLTRAAVSSLVDELIGRGALTEAETASGGGSAAPDARCR